MAGLISTAEATSIRAALALFLTHTATLTPMVPGTADSENSVTYSPGTPVTGVACKYEPEDRIRLDEGGRTTISVPTLKVAHDQTVVVGSQVSNVQDSSGVVLLVGPVTVDTIVAAAGLGPTLSKRLVLRGADVRP